MNIKVDLNDNLPLNKRTEISIVTIVVILVFHQNNKHYPQVILGECLYKI